MLRIGRQAALFLSDRFDLKNGAQGRNRTTDTVIFSHVLYQLSYLGASAASGSGGYKGARARLSSPASRAGAAYSSEEAAIRSPASSTGGPGTR